MVPLLVDDYDLETLFIAEELFSSKRSMLRTPPAWLKREVYERDKYTCQHCGRRRPEVVLHVDHIFPWTMGGTTELRNLQVLCSSYNLQKGAKPNRKRRQPPANR